MPLSGVPSVWEYLVNKVSYPRSLSIKELCRMWKTRFGGVSIEPVWLWIAHLSNNFGRMFKEDRGQQGFRRSPMAPLDPTNQGWSPVNP